MHMKKGVLIALLVLCFSAALVQGKKECDEGWITLFNGKDLTGWLPKVTGYDLGENPLDTFRVEDGAMVVSYDKYPEEGFKGKFGHIFYEKPFTYYRFSVEFLFTGEQLKGGPGFGKANSGIMLHCQNPKSMDKKQKFPTSFEFQFRAQAGKRPRVCGSLYRPGGGIVTYKGKDKKKGAIKSKVKAPPMDTWIKAEAVVSPDGTIKHYVNNELALEYSNPRHKDGTSVKGGYISLQSESHPVKFRNIKIKELK